MTGEDLEKLMRGDSNIDVEALMRVCAEEHAQREKLSTTRRVWQRSVARERLKGWAAGDSEAVVAAAADGAGEEEEGND